MSGHVYAEALAPNGIRHGGPIQVNSFAAGDQSNPSSDDQPNGGWVLGWSSNDPPNTQGADIFGIDLPPPGPIGPDTILMDDYGTPWTPLEIHGDRATFNGGPADTSHFADIVVDPENLQSTDGVLHFASADGGRIDAAFGLNSRFPEKIDLSGGPFQLTITGRSRFDQNALDNATELRLNIEATLLGPPGTLQLADVLLPRPTAPGTWALIDIAEPADPVEIEIVRLSLQSAKPVVVNYSVTAKSGGDPELWFDDLRVDLVRVPEPGVVGLLAVCGGLLLLRWRAVSHKHMAA